jgi:Flp pilus assembly CpaF family ATPase
MEAKGEPAQDTVKERAKEMLRRSMQPLMLDALADPKTVELILNADGKLWLERLGERMICIGKVAPSRAEAIIKAVAGALLQKS